MTASCTGLSLPGLQAEGRCEVDRHTRDTPDIDTYVVFQRGAYSRRAVIQSFIRMPDTETISRAFDIHLIGHRERSERIILAQQASVVVIELWILLDPVNLNANRKHSLQSPTIMPNEA